MTLLETPIIPMSLKQSIFEPCTMGGRGEITSKINALWVDHHLSGCIAVGEWFRDAIIIF